MFSKKIEDFSCERCGCSVKGNGYTNHCPKCLWSKHVDLFPGDRLARCGGMMEPVLAKEERRRRRVTHRCVRCGYEKINDLSSEDNFEEFLSLLKRSSQDFILGK